MSQLTISPEAEQDLVDIWRYIAEDQPINADRFLDRLKEQAQRLAEFTNLGADRSYLVSGLKSFPVGGYVLFYRPVMDGIELVRVLHGSRDVASFF